MGTRWTLPPSKNEDYKERNIVLSVNVARYSLGKFVVIICINAYRGLNGWWVGGGGDGRGIEM